METTMKDILDFANENSTAWLATADDNQPYVRGMWMWYADETGFYFHTAKAKRLYHQISKNPKVAAAFIRNANTEKFSTLHVEGVAEEVHDDALMEKLLKERSWLAGNINRSGVDTEVVIFRIAHGQAYIWDMSWNVNESKIPRISF
jgi:uncharacterized pyridoxamine 5'-phosphate oxidase family protein